MRLRSKTRKIFNRFRSFQRKNVNQRSWRTNVERLKQEFFLFRWVDSQQYQVISLRYPTQGIKDGCYFPRKLYCYLRDVQESWWTIHRHVQKKGFPPLVHWWRYGRDGIHWSWIQHERSRLRVLTISGRHCWRRRGNGRRRNGMSVFSPIQSLNQRI